MWLPSMSASVIIITLLYRNFRMSNSAPVGFSPSSISPFPPKPVPSAVIIDWISLFDKSLSILAFSAFITLPLSGKIAWYRLSLPCLAEPPAESPSTRNISHISGSLLEQSASFPGSEPPSRALLRLISSRAFRAAALLRADNTAFSTILLPTEGFCSRNSCSPSKTIESTRPFTSPLPSLVLV